MEKIFEKHESLFSILLIVIYVVVNSYLIQNYTINHHITAIVLTIMSLLIIGLIIALKRVNYYGIRKVENAKGFLYFIPLAIISVNTFWSGINTNVSAYEIILHILSMINVGFLEEIIFRGFLFKMMEKSSLKSAIIVTSLTFGIGHVVNLLNGADLIPTLFQIGYAISLGFLFVIILYKGKSLIPCILSHMTINSLSVFLVENTISEYVTPTLLIIIPLCYAIYIQKAIKEETK